MQDLGILIDGPVEGENGNVYDNGMNGGYGGGVNGDAYQY